jgi:hypothetical protein
MSAVIDCLPNIEYNNILVVNALNGVLALLLREKYPNAKIVCAEYFPWFKPFLSKLGFAVLDWDEVIGMKFDLVVGNPPYQKDNLSGRDDDNLWPSFLEKANDLVENNGYICFVTPASWASLGTNLLKPGSKIRKINFDTKQVIMVDFTIKRYFDVGSSFSSYILKKSPPSDDILTTFVFADKTIRGKFSDHVCFPLNYSNSEFSDILKNFRSKEHYDFVIEDPYPVARTSMVKKLKNGEYSEVQTELHPYRSYHTNAQTHRWSKYKNSFHNNWKAVFSYSGTWKVEVTNDCSLTDASMCVICDSEEQAKSVQSVLQSEPIKFLIDKVFRWSGYYSGIFIQMIPQLPMDKIYSVDEIYDHLFTASQKDLIKNLIS